VTKSLFVYKLRFLWISGDKIRSMGYRELEVDTKRLTIDGVKVRDLQSLRAISSAIGSNMFEGFEPDQKTVEVIVKYLEGRSGWSDVITFVRNHARS
jgi:hypothetical protein